VGEVFSALPLVRALKRQYPEKKVLFSATTREGMRIAKQELAGAGILFAAMPLDCWWSLHRITKSAKPELFILVETDLWPGLLFHLKKKRIPAVLVNGRISPKTFRKYRRFSLPVRIMWGQFSLCLLQSDLDMRRLSSIGMKPELVEVVGNIKYDQNWIPLGIEEEKQWRQQLKLRAGEPVLVAGSTHEGEETILFEAFGKLRALSSDLRMIVAPRRIERSKAIQELSESRGLRTILRSQFLSDEDSYDVLVLDTVGELGRLYGLGSLCFVGGSLVSEGGHNLLEPARFGCPVLFGTHIEDFQTMAELLVEAGGGRYVRDAQELYQVAGEILLDERKRYRMGRAARGFVKRNQGAVERVMEAITHLLGKEQSTRSSSKVMPWKYSVEP
jgi:3-deoxy-D-manno-octulosonic-acid transferase